MAIEVYGTTVAMVINEMGGIDRQSITSTSTPSTTTVEGWIEEGAGILNGIISSRGIVIDSDNGKAVMRSGIKAYAKARLYEHFNRPQAASVADQQFRDAKREARDMAEDIDGYDANSVFATNIDTANPQRKQFAAKDRNNNKLGGFSGW